MSANLVAISRRDAPWHPLSDQVVIGKDILELLSSSMYIDPMTIYREYLQNAADAIDQATTDGVLDSPGSVSITIDHVDRRVTIRDNGCGIPEDEFATRMTAFGASTKRGTSARGFRGVGRLAGIGYCQELVFRSRQRGDLPVEELRWDCRRLKNILRAADGKDDLASAVAQVVSARSIRSRDYPARFFEVELLGIVRHRNDQLLNPVAVNEYLSQVAPVPFAPGFRFIEEITNHLRKNVRLADLHVTITGIDEPVYRPFRDGVEYAPGRTDPFTEVEFLAIPSVDGTLAAVGWILHHGYIGALPSRSSIRGLRVRCGNIQVGEDRLFEELFPESRFNSWTVGEVHVVDPRIIPNGRRDHFEQNVHYNHLLTHLLPTAKEIGRRCRTGSVQRKWVRDFGLREQVVRDRIGIIKQGAVSRFERKYLVEEIREAMDSLNVISAREGLPTDVSQDFTKRLDRLQRDIQRTITGPVTGEFLANVAPAKRSVYKHVFDLIYACSSNKATAKLLVDKIIKRLA